MKKVTLGLVIMGALLLVTGCQADEKKEAEGSTSEIKTEERAADSTTDGTSGASEATTLSVPAGTLAIRQLYTAPHGDKSFAVTTVVMDGDKILLAEMDEFQYLNKAEFEGVPNSDGGFGENYPEGLVLSSKLVNDQAYSEMMKEKGQATKKYSESMSAIMNHVKGKTISELEKLVETDPVTDVITGATFADANGYLQAVIDTAKNGYGLAGLKNDDTELTLSQVYGAPHGDKSFSVTSIAKAGDKIAAVYTDEFQFLEAGDVLGVPNADGGFGENFAKGTVLVSKMTNNPAYSKMMTEMGKATQEYAESMTAILEYATGKTVTEIEEDLKANEEMTDVVTGATFSDTTGYVKGIVEAAK